MAQLVSQAAAMRTSVMRPTILNARGVGNILFDEFFTYTIVFTFPLGTETFNQVIQIQSDAHFLVMSTVYTNSLEVGNIVATTAVNKLSILNGGATIQLTDAGNQHFLSSALVPLNSLFGSGELPHIWEFTHLFKRNTAIGIQITGNGVAVAGQVVSLMFNGTKLPWQKHPELGS